MNFIFLPSIRGMYKIWVCFFYFSIFRLLISTTAARWLKLRHKVLFSFLLLYTLNDAQREANKIKCYKQRVCCFCETFTEYRKKMSQGFQSPYQNWAFQWNIRNLRSWNKFAELDVSNKLTIRIVIAYYSYLLLERHLAELSTCNRLAWFQVQRKVRRRCCVCVLFVT